MAAAIRQIHPGLPESHAPHYNASLGGSGGAKETFMLVSQLLAAVEYGQYVSAVKSIPLVILLLIWARLLTWMDKDAEAAHLPRMALNTGGLLGLLIAFALFLFLPNYWLALAGLLVIFLAEVGVFLAMRHQKVGLGDLSTQFSTWIRSLAGKKKATVVKAGQVVLMGSNGAAIEPPPGDAPERGGYDALQEMFTDPLKRNAERIELIATEGSSTVRYAVDGVTYDGTSINKNDATGAVLMLKGAMNLDINDRRKPQLGTMKSLLDGRKQEMQVLTAGSTAGESVVVEVDPKKRHEHKLSEMGFGDDQLKLLDKVIADGSGIVLLAAPRGQGLTSLIYAVLRGHDAFLTHIQTIERDPPTDLEGITQNELPFNAPGPEEAKLTAWVTSQEPDIIMIDRLDDPRSASDLIRFASTDKRVYVGMRAGSTFDALQQWRKLVGDDKLAMKQLKLIVSGRVIRKLCTACKQEYNADPDTLRKMNMSPDRVGKLFQARGPSNPMRDQKGNIVICNFCSGLGFKGRSGVYELFGIDDEVRQTVAAGGSINQLKMLFKKQRRRYLQELAVMRAVSGETSLQEVARVLRVSDSSAPSTGSSSGRPPSSAAPRRAAPSSGA
jgi:type II secretory ATPase GspE/PulE/Tfp pilus assembly ATPase PilB-like protein